MVAVDEKLKPNPNIPTVVYDDPEEEKRINKILLSRKEANENWQQCQKVCTPSRARVCGSGDDGVTLKLTTRSSNAHTRLQYIEQSGPFSAAEIEDPINREGKLEFLRIPKTQVCRAPLPLLWPAGWWCLTVACVRVACHSRARKSRSM
jgi:hypothetical protein